MGRRISRDLRPSLEEIERRELLSAITDVMAGNSIAAGSHELTAAARPAVLHQSIAISCESRPLLNSGNPNNPINNMALAPTGTLTKRQQRKERFAAQFVGTYTVGAGATSDERIQTFITAVGTANTMLHSRYPIAAGDPQGPEPADRWRQRDLRPQPEHQYRARA